MGITYTDRDGVQKPIYLASYGIGVTRVMGVIVEKFADEKGIVWPENVAPAQVYLVSIGQKGSEMADTLYNELQAQGVEVLYEDRDERPGSKFADGELMGIPYTVTLSDRLVEAGQVELKARTSMEQAQLLTKEELFATIGSS